MLTDKLQMKPDIIEKTSADDGDSTFSKGKMLSFFGTRRISQMVR